jgi:hypothetical protein
MENNFRLKVKVGPYEFDAEGPHDVVQAQFEAFQEMIKTSPTPISATLAPESDGGSTTEPPTPSREVEQTVESNLNRIMKVEGRVVSLTARPEAVEDAALLLIYGQRMLRNNEAPTGSEIIDGAVATGRLDLGRTDRLFEKLARQGEVIMIGERRGKRYRLTNSGMAKARQIAAELIATVA